MLKKEKYLKKIKNCVILYLIRPATPLLASAPGQVLIFKGYAI